jgi:uncharacterized protein (TIGR03086 family)
MTTTDATPATDPQPEEAPAPRPLPGGADPRVSIARALDTAAATIDRMRPEHLGLPTPSGMDVELLVGHLIMVAQRVRMAGEAADPWTWPAETTGLAADEWAPAFRAAAAEVPSAWADDERLVRLTVLPWDAMAGSDVVAMYASELTVHTSDLARAIGVEPVWDDEVLAVSEAIMHHLLPDADRQPMWAAAKAAMPPEIPWEDPFANAVEVPADAPAVDRLLAWCGRQP